MLWDWSHEGLHLHQEKTFPLQCTLYFNWLQVTNINFTLSQYDSFTGFEWRP